MKTTAKNDKGPHRLGIVAGAGVLPRALIEKCRQQKQLFFVFALKNQAQPELIPDFIPVKWVRLGAIGTFIRIIKAQKITKMVMIGGVHRPSLTEVWPDWAGFQLATRIGLKRQGDDGLLRGIIRELKALGVEVMGLHEFLPELLAPLGVLTQKQPDVFDMEDISRGCYVTKLLGLADVGQSAVVQQGMVLAVEGVEGTQKLVERSQELRRKGKGGVLVKTIKPQQDSRVDMPTVGVSTVEAVAAAGLKGIAVEAKKVLIPDVAAVAQKADTLKIFIVGFDAESMLPPMLRKKLAGLTEQTGKQSKENGAVNRK